MDGVGTSMEGWAGDGENGVGMGTSKEQTL